MNSVFRSTNFFVGVMLVGVGIPGCASQTESVVEIADQPMITDTSLVVPATSEAEVVVQKPSISVDLTWYRGDGYVQFDNIVLGDLVKLSEFDGVFPNGSVTDNQFTGCDTSINPVWPDMVSAESTAVVPMVFAWTNKTEGFAMDLYSPLFTSQFPYLSMMATSRNGSWNCDQFVKSVFEDSPPGFTATLQVIWVIPNFYTPASPEGLDEKLDRFFLEFNYVNRQEDEWQGPTRDVGLITLEDLLIASKG